MSHDNPMPEKDTEPFLTIRDPSLGTIDWSRFERPASPEAIQAYKEWQARRVKVGMKILLERVSNDRSQLPSGEELRKLALSVAPKRAGSVWDALPWKTEAHIPPEGMQGIVYDFLHGIPLAGFFLLAGLGLLLLGIMLKRGILIASRFLALHKTTWRQRSKVFRVVCFINACWLTFLIVVALWCGSAPFGGMQMWGENYWDAHAIVNFLAALIFPVVGVSCGTYFYQRFVK